MTETRSGEGAERPRGIFVTPGRGVPFIDQDLELLRSVSDLEVLYRSDYPRRSLLARAFKSLARGYRDYVYIWFAEPYDTPALLRLAKWFRAPTAVVVGGYELVSMPEVGYGALTSERNRRRLAAVLEKADLLLPTSSYLERELAELGARDNVVRVDLGIDSDFFSPGEAEREPLAITVARVTRYQWRVKGLDVFARASKDLPETRFVVLGPCPEDSVRRDLLDLGGSNLEVPGDALDPDQVRSWMRRASVYAQLSARESFGAAVAEAMSCECQVVVSDVGSLPDLVGDSGRLVPYGDATAAAEAIRQSMLDPLGGSRRRIVERFDSAVRDRRVPAVLGERLGLALGASDG